MYHYKKPIIKEKKINLNYFLKSKFDLGGDEFLAIYCGQCLTCKGCFLPWGCDEKSC